MRYNYNNNRGVGTIRGVFGEIENSLFLFNTHLLCIYVNSDVTDTCTDELWFC